jgi:hypothetical protein
MAEDVVVVEATWTAERRKLLAMIMGAFAVFTLTVNTTGDTKGALVVLIPSVLASIVAYLVRNTETTPSAKFIAEVAGAVGVLAVFLVQNGWDSWRSAFLVFVTALLKAGSVYWTPNAGTTVVDATEVVAPLGSGGVLPPAV